MIAKKHVNSPNITHKSLLICFIIPSISGTMFEVLLVSLCFKSLTGIPITNSIVLFDESILNNGSLNDILSFLTVDDTINGSCNDKYL